jgi:predicted alpha/beta superfamily hydrolase
MNSIPLSVSIGSLTRYPEFNSKYIPARHVDIWLPPGYDDQPTTRYPVLYMHDGQNLFRPETSTANIPWGVDTALAGLTQAGKTRGAIIVGIWNVGAARWSEYLPQKPAETPEGRQFAAHFSEKLPLPAYSDNYLRFIINELKPFVDQTFRSAPGQKDTSIMGSSMGALVSLYAMTEYPQIFGGAGCLSTHWVAGEQLIVDYFGSVLPKPGNHKLYFDYGTQTLDAAYEPFQLRMDAHLRAAGYTFENDWMTLKFDGAEHSERSWRERVHIPLMFLLGKS